MIERLIPYKEALKRFIPAGIREQVKFSVVRRRFRKIAGERAPREDLPFGVNMAAPIGGGTGLSEASRGVLAGLQNAGVPVNVWDFDREEENVSQLRRINLIHANPNQLPELLFSLPERQWESCYNIGFWVWELERIPREWTRYFALFDEIWTPSEFSAAAIRRDCPLPVYVIPHLVEPVCDPEWDRTRWGLPEDVFLVLVAFDCDSVVERKNPLGAVRAFLRAFPNPSEPVGLVIKARNMTEELSAQLKGLLAGRERVYIFPEDCSKAAMNSLVREADVYLSLHRAEGFGLIIAEAMYLGTPVVATNWSGNTEFMSKDTACLVDAELMELTRDYPPFRRGSRWARPDEGQAAEYLRRLYEDRAYREGMAERAGAAVRERLSLKAISGLIKTRMDDLRGEMK